MFVFKGDTDPLAQNQYIMTYNDSISLIPVDWGTVSYLI